jgi:hypothetical protein
VSAVSVVAVMAAAVAAAWDGSCGREADIGSISGQNQVDIGVDISCVTAMYGAPMALHWPYTSP